MNIMKYSIFLLILIPIILNFQSCIIFDSSDSDDNGTMYLYFIPETEDIPSNSFYIKMENPVEDMFFINVYVKDITNLYGTAFTLVFDPSLMLLIDANQGPFLSNGNTSFMANLEENHPGRLIIGYTRLGDAPGANGSGLICSIMFKALREGEGNISFDNANGIDGNGNFIEGLSWFGGIIRSINI